MWYSLLVLLPLVAVNAASEGSCPEMTAVQNFNATAWIGMWYVIYMSPDDPVFQGNCGFSEDTLNDDGLGVKMWFTNDAVQSCVEGSASAEADPDNSAKFTLSLKYGDDYHVYPAVIGATDYDNYGAVYICAYDEASDTHEIYPWFISKSKVLEGDLLTTLDEIVSSSTLVNGTQLVQNSFSDEACQFTSEVNLSN